MELNICHLYPELLNMYGDIGNILILKSRAAARGIDVKVINYSVGDTFDSENTDIVMFGGGQDFEMSVVEQDIKDRIIGDIRMFIETGGVMLAICGGYQMLGRYYVTPEGERLDGLGILQHYTEGGKRRLIGNIATDIDGYLAIGFENHAGRTYIGDMEPLGKVLKGFGNNGEDGYEGLRYKNTYCTYLHGPFLSKNPRIADELISAALKRKYGTVSLTPLDDDFEDSARRMMQKKMEV